MATHAAESFKVCGTLLPLLLANAPMIMKFTEMRLTKHKYNLQVQHVPPRLSKFAEPSSSPLLANEHTQKNNPPITKLIKHNLARIHQSQRAAYCEHKKVVMRQILRGSLYSLHFGIVILITPPPQRSANNVNSNNFALFPRISSLTTNIWGSRKEILLSERSSCFRWMPLKRNFRSSL